MGEVTAASIGMSEEEFAGLTDEERKAFDEVPDEEKKVADTGEGDPNKGKAGTDADKAKAAEDAAATAKAAADAEAAKTVADAEPANTAKEAVAEAAKTASGDEAGKVDTTVNKGEPAPFVPVYQSDAKIDEINTKLTELDKKLTEGELDIVEYNNQRDALIEARTEAKMTAKFNAQSAEQLWKYEQTTFFNFNPDYKTDPVLNGALSTVFRQLEAQEENRSKSGLQLLNEAKAEVDKRLAALGGGKASAPTQEPKKGEEDKGKRSALDTAEIPKTLAGVPAADESDTGKDEFAYLDKLDGIEFEKALSKLTKDQEQRYLRGRTD